jgi:hypothetical protein
MSDGGIQLYKISLQLQILQLLLTPMVLFPTGMAVANFVHLEPEFGHLSRWYRYPAAVSNRMALKLFSMHGLGCFC